MTPNNATMIQAPTELDRRSRRLACARCGTAFECGTGGSDGGCWCIDETYPAADARQTAPRTACAPPVSARRRQTGGALRMKHGTPARAAFAFAALVVSRRRRRPPTSRSSATGRSSRRARALGPPGQTSCPGRRRAAPAQFRRDICAASVISKFKPFDCKSNVLYEPNAIQVDALFQGNLPEPNPAAAAARLGFPKGDIPASTSAASRRCTRFISAMPTPR